MNHQDKLTKTNFPKGFATTEELKAAGISGYCINRLCYNGDIIRLKHGLYKIKALKISDERDVILAAIPQGVFCMSEALYIYGFRKRKPYEHEIAVPRGFVHSDSRFIKDVDLQIYNIKPEHFEIGLTVSPEGYPCYDLERTICDYFKNHTRISYRCLRELSKQYRKYENKDIIRLQDYAEQLNLSVAAKQKMDWLILHPFHDFKIRKKIFAANKNTTTVKIREIYYT
ncbi:MAG: type IV toxin-antitoxin system AbiEi family antitoxin domain-containing protein [Clostridia bacterium]|nr:type IV toxin-antitoxin system AbiEi family antitoxin domain-containing protein [Clostridia bacterium]